MRLSSIAFSISGLAVAAVLAGDVERTPAAAVSRCSAAPYHQFDFWLGNWEVRNPNGTLQGTNDVTKIQAGCVLQEHWAGSDGSAGTSFNVFYAGDKQWHQTWVDNNGGLLMLAGGIKDGAMVLAGSRVARTGGRVIDRIRWSKMSGGRVRQFWDQSTDDGRTWSTVFDGIYSPKS